MVAGTATVHDDAWVGLSDQMQTKHKHGDRTVVLNGYTVLSDSEVQVALS